MRFVRCLLGKKPKASCILSKYSINCAISPVLALGILSMYKLVNFFQNHFSSFLQRQSVCVSENIALIIVLISALNVFATFYFTFICLLSVSLPIPSRMGISVFRDLHSYISLYYAHTSSTPISFSYSSPWEFPFYFFKIQILQREKKKDV